MYLHNMANNPDWVLKYKKKWTLVQKKRDDLYITCTKYTATGIGT